MSNKNKSEKLITKQIEKQFNNIPFRMRRNFDNKVIVKFYNSKGSFIYLITEAKRKPNGDWLMFGYCREGAEWKWKTVSLYALTKANKTKDNNVQIKRDKFITSSSIFEEVLLTKSSSRSCI